ncbi:MAG: hypothetical protein ABW078_12795 [Sedimenticola sp.]
MEQLSWFYGPERHAFSLDEAGTARAGEGDPFHGIVGRGMLELLDARGADPQQWLENAHRLFCTEVGDHDAAGLTELRALAEQSGTLSFGDSACCVQRYLEQHCAEATREHMIEAWNIKEGHDSSVWKITIVGADGLSLKLVLNVGRDYVASAELRKSSEQMRALQQRHPEIEMAPVLDIQTIVDDADREVVVTRNAWVPGAHEIHAVASDDPRGYDYVLVERFLTDAELPACIVSVFGRRFDETESRCIDAGLERFRELAEETLPNAPRINLNEGDLVWDGRSAVVVAVS